MWRLFSSRIIMLVFLILCAAATVLADNNQLSTALMKMDNLSDFAAKNSDYSEMKTPARIVHAKGFGAKGYFEVTHDISHLSKACVFKRGTKTPVLARFSLAGGSRSAPDSAQDGRGLAVRFYTTCGNWDLLGNPFGVFAFSEPWDVPSLISALQAGNATKAQDIFSRHPEAAFQLIVQNSYLGAPISARHMDIGAANTFKLVAKSGTPTYAKFHLISEQKEPKYQNFTAAKALAQKNPNHAREDLKNAIASGNFPAWKLMIQTMSYDVAQKVPIDPLDPSYIWPQDEFPLKPVGRVLLNKNPVSLSEEIEKAAFNPGNLIPGIEPSCDPVLLFRTTAYSRVQRKRLGGNYTKIPVNTQKRAKSAVTKRESQCVHPQNEVMRDDLKGHFNHLQAAKWYRSRPVDEQKQIVMLINAGILKGLPPTIRDRHLRNFDRVDKALGDAIRAVASMPQQQG